MSDKKRQQPTFSTVGKEQKHIVAMPEKLRVEMPEINFNPQFSPQFSPEFKPILTLEPQYQIKVEPAHFSAIIEPTPLHSHNHVTVPPAQVEHCSPQSSSFTGRSRRAAKVFAHANTAAKSGCIKKLPRVLSSCSLIS